MRYTHLMSVCLSIVLALSGTASAALEQIEAPGPPKAPALNELLMYGVMIVLVAVVCAGAMKSAKRTHQD